MTAFEPSRGRWQPPSLSPRREKAECPQEPPADPLPLGVARTSPHPEHSISNSCCNPRLLHLTSWPAESPCPGQGGAPPRPCLGEQDARPLCPHPPKLCSLSRSYPVAKFCLCKNNDRAILFIPPRPSQGRRRQTAARQVAHPRAARRARHSTCCFHTRDLDRLHKFGSPASRQEGLGYQLTSWLALSNPAAEIQVGIPH